MSRVLVVQQFVAPGSAQDQQRGDMYAPLYAAAGHRVRYIGRRPAFARRLNRGPHRWARVVRESIAYKLWYRLLDRVVRRYQDGRIVRHASRADVIHLIKTDSFHLVHRLRRRTKAKLVYDLADALWLPRHANGHRDIERILGLVDAVTCDNETGLRYAREYCRETHLWPPASYIEEFDQVGRPNGDEPATVTIGWLGSPGTASNLYLVLEALEELFQQHPNVHLRLLGISPQHDLLSRFEHVRYSCVAHYTSHEMVQEVARMDIGLFPMFDLQESATHGITKGLIYMAGGAVVVASPIGPVVDLIQDDVNGYLASNRRDWTVKVRHLIEDAAARRRVAGEATRHARANYSLKHCFEAMSSALES